MRLVAKPDAVHPRIDPAERRIGVHVALFAVIGAVVALGARSLFGHLAFALQADGLAHVAVTLRARHLFIHDVFLVREGESVDGLRRVARPLAHQPAATTHGCAHDQQGGHGQEAIHYSSSESSDSSGFAGVAGFTDAAGGGFAAVVCPWSRRNTTSVARRFNIIIACCL